MPSPDRRRVTDIDALRTLAHPVRYRLLGHLMAVGPRTASECAAVVGESPSNCSYHLRELARFGLVERAGGGAATDGRERPWRATATGWDMRADDAGGTDPAAVAANTRLLHAGIDEEARLAHRAIDEAPALPAEWTDAAIDRTYGLRLTPAELTDLHARLDALLRPYIGLTRDDVPAGAEPVHVTLRAFRQPGT